MAIQGYTYIGEKYVPPTFVPDIVRGPADKWDCLIDDKYVFVGLQEIRTDVSKYLPQWRVTVYQGEAQGVDKFFDNLHDAKVTFNALDKCVPTPRTLVDVWGFDWNW